MNGKLVQMGDTFYIEVAQPMSNEPIMVIQCWRVNAIDGEYEIGETLAYDGIWRGRRVRIGTELQSAECEQRLIPCPKTKLKTRWSELGYWQKYTATKGWVIA